MLDDLLFTAACVVLLFHACFWGLRTFQTTRAFVRVPQILPHDERPLPQDAPFISLLVPAHNEESEIRECVESVLQQDYPRFELILIDDRSKDRTASIARELAEGQDNFRVISIDELPAGWTGKCHALDEGVRHARGEWLAFLDADSRLHPCALRACYYEAVRRGVSMVTLTPGAIVSTFWEKVLQPVFLGMCSVLFPPDRVNDPTSKVASANGMFYLISRSAYLAIGGHRGVRNLAVEDIGIGKRVKACGLGLLFANGREILKTRMYKSIGEILEGWARILAAAMNYRLLKVFRHLVAQFLVSLPAVALALCAYFPQAMELWPQGCFFLPFICLTGVCITTCMFYPMIAVPRRYALLLFLGNLALVAVLAMIVKRIAWNDALRWRGTTYEVTRYEPAALDPDPSELGSSGPPPILSSQ